MLNTGLAAQKYNAYISESSYIGEQSLSAQRDSHYVKISGSVTLSQNIPNAANTKIGTIKTNERPLAETYFCFLTPQSIPYLAYITTNADIYICNYRGSVVSTGTILYSVGFEWFF